MRISECLVVLRGGGDLATGIAYRLSKAGFPVVVLELARPLVVRRRVALATAVLEDRVEVEGLVGQRVDTLRHALALAPEGVIPVLVSPELPSWNLAEANRGPGKGLIGPAPSVIIDARMAKRNIDTKMEQAPLVIALGPGFEAGVDCHVVVETKRGHRLGRAITDGGASPDTGIPGNVAGKGAERVLRAPADGVANWRYDIGDLVAEGAVLGDVGGAAIRAPFAGALRGLIAPGTRIRMGLKVGDLDARADVSACFTISDKALSVAGGVLEAILAWMRPEG